MRYKAVVKREGDDLKDLTEPKSSVEDVLKALHNQEPSTEGTIKYDASESEVRIMKGRLLEKTKAHSKKKSYRREWSEVTFK